MIVKFTVDTEKKGFTMEPTNEETVKWFLNNFPVYMGAYYGAFIRQVTQNSKDNSGIQDVSENAMKFMSACMGEINFNKGDIIDVEAKEVEEDTNRRVLMPQMPSGRESACERRLDERVHNN